MSKYDDIETAADLVAEVAIHGLSIKQEDINRAQDIFGNSTIEDLVTLANDIGRKNEKGEPDPKGTWSTGRKGTQDTFYFVAFNIWNWRDATAFYIKHTHPMTEANRQLAKENKELTASLATVINDRKDIKEQLATTTERAKEYAYKIDDLNATIQQKQAEIIDLKAKLYDAMTAQVAS